MLENQPSVVSQLVDRGVRHLVYLLHSRIEAVQAAVAHVAMCRDLNAPFDYTTLVMPRKMKVRKSLIIQISPWKIVATSCRLVGG